MPQKKVYSNDLGIDLNSGDETECFKWFLACLLFGKPIQQEIAKRAFLELRQAGITSPNAILETGWNGLVEILDKAHYVRYDFSTATKLQFDYSPLRAITGAEGCWAQDSRNLPSRYDAYTREAVGIHHIADSRMQVSEMGLGSGLYYYSKISRPAAPCTRPRRSCPPVSAH
jgi:hypothetical protein